MSTEPLDPVAAAPAPSAPAVSAAPAHPSLWRQPLFIALLIALALLAWQWLETRSRISVLQAELATRLEEGRALANETRGVARQSMESVNDLRAKLGSVESRIEDAQGQQSALASMYQEVTRTRDERVLAEAEHAINIALQQLQLAGNVQGALLALSSADAQLARADRPQFLTLRKAIAHDIDRLKLVSVPDLTGMALKLETVAGGIDALPLAFEERPAAPAAPAAKTPESAPDGVGAKFAGDVWKELKSLVRVDRLDRTDPALLSPSNAFFVRENLKLRLLNARLALLQRDARTYSDDLRQSQAWVERFFDTRAKSVQNAQAALHQLAGAGITLELPALTETVTALSATRVTPERSAPAPRAPAPAAAANPTPAPAPAAAPAPARPAR